MKLETFFEKFDRFADAPDAVAKMRELVLHLGVTGKLSEDSEAWTEFPIGEVSRLRRGYDLPTQDRKSGSVPIFAANGPVGVHEIHKVRGPGVVTGRSGSIGKVHFVDENFWPLNTALYVEDFFGNYPQFICLLLRSLHLERFSTATAVPTLNRNVVHKEIVKVPPLAEQKRIVAKVNELMALCDRLEAQQQERETRHAALARASLARFADAPTPANLSYLFHSSFIIPPSDLRRSILTLAVQGKLVPQDPNDEPAETLCEPDEELAAASSFEVSHGWIWTRLAKLAEINGGFAFKSTAYTEEGTRVVRISDFDEFGFKDHKVVRHPFSADLQKFTLEEQNILMAMTGGTVGKSYFVRSMPEAMVVNQRVATIKVLNSALPSYIDIVIRSEMTQEVIQKAKNSTNDNISMGDIKGFTIPLPPLAEQRRIVAKVEQLMALVDALETQLAASRATAANLLSALIAELTNQTPDRP
jgi:type I restriction enzyme S subunit